MNKDLLKLYETNIENLKPFGIHYEPEEITDSLFGKITMKHKHHLIWVISKLYNNNHIYQLDSDELYKLILSYNPSNEWYYEAVDFLENNHINWLFFDRTNYPHYYNKRPINFVFFDINKYRNTHIRCLSNYNTQVNFFDYDSCILYDARKTKIVLKYME